MRLVLLVITGSFVLGSLAWSAEPAATDLNVFLAGAGAKEARSMVSRSLRKAAYEAFDRRKAEYEATKTPEEIQRYQQRRREFFIVQLGGLPDRTPLNPQIVGTIDGEGFRIEKLIFESRPRHYVTALFYLPKSKGPYPGVIVPCGHTANGKTGYQSVCVILACNGIAALCYDPIGQGERYQVLDPKGKPLFKSTDEHTLVDVGSILVGRSTASYRVWDGMRALDYLESRPEIDARRLGCTGSSGGGTLTEYLMALDPRIACAVPSCCITSFQRRIETNKIGDGEQNVFGQIAFGLDHADYALLRAPRPTLFSTATHDFVDISGAWDVFREAKRFYARLGYSERVDLIEVDGQHGFTGPKREAMVRWMRRWLLGQDDAITETPYEGLSHDKLLCSPQGQAQLLPGALSVMDLNAARMEELAPQRRELWQSSNRTRALAEVRRLASIRPLADITRPQVAVQGSVERDGYRIEKLLLKIDPIIELPALVFHPAKPNSQRVLYLHGEGKQADAGPESPIAQMVHGGATVLAVDLRGSGEIGGGAGGIWGGQWEDIFLGYLLGRTMVGMRAEDTLAAARYLAELSGNPTLQPVTLIAQGQAGPAALHAAALEPHLFQRVTLVDPLTSWQDVVRQSVPRGQLVNVVHAALEKYDLSDLASVLREMGKLEAPR